MKKDSKTIKDDTKKVKSVKTKSDVKKEKKTNKKKENVFKKISKYFKGVGKEIKRIKWTTKKDLFKYSVAAIVFVLFFALYFYGIDWIALLVRSLVK